ncbi:MAG TPA: alanine--glyoxylate aminotransferase family protein [Candidatus Methylomirabilis sp.]|nr:alanine--glyoxylate aminotransferase family protein [Candidatus Methylomirabilis sp.]
MKKTHLFAPGPTPIPPEALLTMAHPILHHRTPEYEALLAEVREGLKVLFQTTEEVLLFAASGTGGMEAAVVNTLSPGEKALVIRGGKFGERWGEICEAYGVNFTPIDVPYGKAVDPGLVVAALAKDPQIAVVFSTYSETSTGVLHDIKAIAEAVRKTPALLVVDAITSLGVMDVPMDDWGLDVVVAGSQKALMLPPGLALVGVSRKAWAAVERSRLPKYYFDFAAEQKHLLKNQSRFTPAISLVVGLRETLRMIRSEGLPNIFRRHERLAAAMRAGITALGLELFAERPSPAVTAVRVPRGLDGGAILKTLRTRHRVIIAGGQGSMKGKIFRLATMGYADSSDVVVALSALELTLAELGYPVKLGDGIRAAQEVLQRQ